VASAGALLKVPASRIRWLRRTDGRNPSLTPLCWKGCHREQRNVNALSSGLEHRASLLAALADPVDPSRLDHSAADCGLLLGVSRIRKIGEEVRAKRKMATLELFVQQL
jgi:hypothetical protein